MAVPSLSVGHSPNAVPARGLLIQVDPPAAAHFVAACAAAFAWCRPVSGKINTPKPPQERPSSAYTRRTDVMVNDPVVRM
jgi:hypothetical protein